MPVTIKDVAKAAGVSASTVSRALQDHPRISVQTRQRVKKVVLELGYSVNNVARSLKTNRSRVIGFVCPELNNVFFMQVGKGIEDALNREGYSLIVCSSGESSRNETARLQLLQQQCVDGIILIPATHEGSHLQQFFDAGIPIVLIDRKVDGFSTDAVLVDNVDGSYAATKVLLKTGCHPIAYIGGNKSLTTARERETGFRKAHADDGLEVDETLVFNGNFHWESGYKLMKKLSKMSPFPKTLFVANYYMFVGVVRYLVEEGVRRHQVGELPLPNMTLANFDRFEDGAVFHEVAVVVEQPMEEMGQKAVQLLLKRIEGNRVDFPLELRLKTKLST